MKPIDVNAKNEKQILMIYNHLKIFTNGDFACALVGLFDIRR